MIFSELIVNDKNWKHLCNAFNNDRLPHALLFHGEEGMGKEAHALELAALLSCENIKNGDSCGNCSSCNKIRTFKHVFGLFCTQFQLLMFNHILNRLIL